jgi:hypothetical protein
MADGTLRNFARSLRRGVGFVLDAFEAIFLVLVVLAVVLFLLGR